MSVIPVIADWSFDDLYEGMSQSVNISISEEDVDVFAHLSGDVNPLHMDAAFARERGFSNRVAHGTLLSSYVSRLLGTHIPGKNCLLQSLNIRFIAPVYVNETVCISVEITQISIPMRTILLAVSIKSLKTGSLLAKGKAQTGFTKENSQL